MALELYTAVFLLLLLFIDVKDAVSLDNKNNNNNNQRYSPTWDSLDSRPLPAWYDQAKIGIFLHWGVFSVPSFGSEWFWHSWQTVKDPRYVEFVKKFYPPGWTYADFAPQFRAEFFDPQDWARLFAKSGAKYVVLTSKHHEGFTNWPSAVSFNWNSMDVGPKRDLVGELASAVRKETDLKFGLYHSWFEWYNPLYLQDKANSFQTNDFVVSKTMPELKEIVTSYKPEVIWSDGDWEAPTWYWNATLFLSWLYNDSPVKETVVVNDRWGQGTFCKHGGFWNCADRYNPGTMMKHKWENAFTLDKSSWGFNRDSSLSNYLTREELLHEVVSTVAFGGNCLINVGPTADGRIVPVFRERLSQLGAWLDGNGEAVYATRPCPRHQNDTLTPEVFFTCSFSDERLVRYATFFHWPLDGLRLGSLSVCPPKEGVTFLGAGGKIIVPCAEEKGRIRIDVQSLGSVLLKAGMAGPWTLKFQY